MKPNRIGGKIAFLKVVSALSCWFFVISFACAQSETKASDEDWARLKNAFELRLGVYGDVHAKQVDKLKDGYLGALEKLKLSLGKEGDLDRAAEVLAEMDLIKSGQKLPKLKASADSRLRALRAKWDGGTEAAQGKLAKDSSDLARMYLKKLAGAEAALTQSGNIREALEVKKEAERVNGMKLLLEGAPKKPKSFLGLNGERAEGDLALLSKGASVTGASNPEAMIDGRTNYDTSGKGYSVAGLKSPIGVDLGKKYVVERIRLYLLDVGNRTYKFTLEGSINGTKWVKLKDQTDRFARAGWQNIRFDQQDLRYLRIVGTEASSGSALGVIELEVFGPK